MYAIRSYYASDSSTKPLAFFFVLLASIYGLWLAALWPGLLGEDSLAVMLEVDRQVQWSSGKPAVWVYFVRAFYGSTGLVEIPIGVQLLVTAFVFARVLAWCRQARVITSYSIHYTKLYDVAAHHHIGPKGDLIRQLDIADDCRRGVNEDLLV